MAVSRTLSVRTRCFRNIWKNPAGSQGDRRKCRSILIREIPTTRSCTELSRHLRRSTVIVHLDGMTRHKPVPGHEVKQHVYGNNCFGCGPENEGGLHLDFHLNEDRKRFVCEFILPRRFEGPPMHSHGGIIATILDEAMGKVSKLRSIIAVTATMQVNYCLLYTSPS